MVKAWDVRRKQWVEVGPAPIPSGAPAPAPEVILDLNDLKKLIEYARSMGWI